MCLRSKSRCPTLAAALVHETCFVDTLNIVIQVMTLFFFFNFFSLILHKEITN